MWPAFHPPNPVPVGRLQVAHVKFVKLYVPIVLSIAQQDNCFHFVLGGVCGRHNFLCKQPRAWLLCSLIRGLSVSQP